MKSRPAAGWQFPGPGEGVGPANQIQRYLSETLTGWATGCSILLFRSGQVRLGQDQRGQDKVRVVGQPEKTKYIYERTNSLESGLATI